MSVPEDLPQVRRQEGSGRIECPADPLERIPTRIKRGEIGGPHRMWAGEEVNHDGSFAVRRARLYTRPSSPPALLAAALTEDTARWAASWADGLITVSAPRDRLRRLADAFREGGGEGKPMHLQVKLSYDADEAKARRGAHKQWRTNVLSAEASENLCTPQQYEALAAQVTEADVAGAVRISSDTQRHLAWLQEDLALGFERLYLHNVNRTQSAFIDDFGADVLPRLR